MLCFCSFAFSCLLLFFFFSETRWKLASSLDTGLELVGSSEELGAKHRAPVPWFNVFIRNPSHLFSQVLQVTCREYSKAVSEVSFGLTVVRKSYIKTALICSAYSPTLEQTQGFGRRGWEERASQWELFFPYLLQAFNFNECVIFFNFISGRSAACEPYFALCSHSLNFLSPPWWFEEGRGKKKKKENFVAH